MEENSIIYKVKTASVKEINTHLIACNDNFVPPLNSKVDVKAYAEKLFEKAISFEAWDRDLLAGLVAAYFNDPANKVAFITNVSLLTNFMKHGIASKLLHNCISYAREKNFMEIDLEVNKHSKPAIFLYEKFNFKQYNIKGDMVLMKLELN